MPSISNPDASTPSITEVNQNTPFRRAFSMFGTCIAKICSGTIYASSLWTNQMAHKYGWSQTQVASISSLGIAAFFFSGPFIGHAVDKLDQPTAILMLAAFLVPVGNVLLGSMYRVPAGSHWTAAIYFALVGLGSSCGSHGSLAPTVRNFPESQAGLAVAIPISFFGLSTFIFATLARLVFMNSPESTPEISPGIPDLFKKKPRLDVGNFLITVGIIALCGYLIAAFLVKDLRGNKKRRRRSSMEADLARIAARTREATRRGVRPARLLPEEQPKGLWEWLGFKKRSELQPLIPKPDSGDSRLISHLLELPTFLWITSFLILAGTGLQYINSVSSILLSLAPKQHSPHTPSLQRAQAFHVALISLFSFLGRIVTGIVTDFAKKYQIRRITFYVYANILMLWTQIWGATQLADLADEMKSTGSTKAVYHSWVVILLTICIGFAYGTLFVLGPTICTNLYGRRYFASNWGAQASLVALGGVIFTHIYGNIYDAHNPHKELEIDYRRTCRGSECFQTSFIVNASACALALLFSSLLWSVSQTDDKMNDCVEPSLPALRVTDAEGMVNEIEAEEDPEDETRGMSPTEEELIQGRAVVG